MLSLCYRGVSMKVDRIQTGLRLESELLYKITQVAKYNKRSLNAQLEFLVEECVRNFERENGEIRLDYDEIYKR